MAVLDNMHPPKILASLLASTSLALLIGCSAGGSGAEDLGSFGGGKADFVGLSFDLPCLDAKGHGDNVAEFTLSGSGPFEINITQPNVASGDRAYARIVVNDGEVEQETESSKAPSLEWIPDGDSVHSYSVEIVNRSTTKELCAHFELATIEVEESPWPTARRTFAPGQANFQDFETAFVPVAFFDADSTLRISVSGRKTPNGADDVLLLPGVGAGIADAVDRGMVIAVVSNQGGVHYGSTTFEDAEAALAKTAQFIHEKGTGIHYFDFAPEYDDFRKPQTGMAEEFEAQFEAHYGLSIDWDHSFMVGDAGWKRDVDLEPDGTPGEDFSNSDRGFAENMEIPFIHPREYFGWGAKGVRNFHTPEEVEAFLVANPDFPE